MATSVSLGYCLWLAGQTWNDSIGRNQHVAGTFYQAEVGGGVLYDTNTPLQLTLTSGLAFTLATGGGIVPSSTGDGAYEVYNTALQTLTCNTADPTNPRIDLVCLQVTDNMNNTSFAQLEIVAGTPAASPSVPATPSNGIALYQVRVNANAVSLTGANVTDVRTYTAAAGGVLVTPNLAALPAGYNGLTAYYPAGNYFYHLTPSGVAAMHVLTIPFSETIVTGAITYAANVLTTLASVNFTGNGNDCEYTFRCAGIGTATTGNVSILRLTLDGTTFWQANLYSADNRDADGFFYQDGPQEFTYRTSATKGTTPGSGAHTLAATIICVAINGKATASSLYPIQLGVRQASV
jgi:hypothetical protein